MFATAFLAWVLALSALLLTGCATQNYGRLPDVGVHQAQVMDCSEINLEIAKTTDWLAQIRSEHDKFTPSDVTGFLGDFGIGNAIEYSNATKSADERLKSLNAAKSIRCPSVVQN